MRLSLADKMAYLNFRWHYCLDRRRGQKNRVAIEDIVPDHESFVRVQQLSMAAWHHYDSSCRYHGPLVLVRDMMLNNPLHRRALSHPTWGWDRYIDGPIIVHDIDCDHRKMFQEPALGKIAGVLRDEITRACEHIL